MPSATNIHNLIIMYEKLCEDVSLRFGNFKENIICFLILFQKNIHCLQVYDSVMSNIFVDWEHVRMLPIYSIYKDPNSWITLMNFVECENDDLCWKQLCSQNAIFMFFSESLTSLMPKCTHGDIMKLFLLLNIQNLDAMCIFEMYFSGLHHTNVREQGMLFFSKLANQQFDKKDRTEALMFILQSVLHVKVDDFINEVELFQSSRDSIKQSMIQKHMRVVCKRPKLRSKQRACTLVEDDTFKTWKDRIRFANCFSVVNAKKLYFLMSQTHSNKEKLLHVHVKEEELRNVIMANIINTPEVLTLTEVISQARICEAPFAELHRFREFGIASFSISQKSRIRLNDLLHLYIAAYQKDWKSVWRSIVPILSSQIIHDVNDFVQTHEYNLDEVCKIIFAD